MEPCLGEIEPLQRVPCGTSVLGYASADAGFHRHDAIEGCEEICSSERDSAGSRYQLPGYWARTCISRATGSCRPVEWASLRPTWFQQNFAEQPWHVKSIQEENSFYSATGEGKIPWISTVDIAACAFELLTQDEAPNSEYLLLGPELLSYNKIADILTEVVGRKIVHKDISAEELDERRSVFGMPRDYAQMMSSLDTDIKNGSENRLNNVVEEMTGKPPGKFRDFAEQNKHVWIRG